MPHLKKEAWIPCSIEHAYQVVASVQDYPCFLPGCRGVRILQEDTGRGALVWMETGYGPFQLAYTSHVTFDPYRQIRAVLAHGPLKSLEALWDFENDENHGLKVTHHLQMSFHEAWKNVCLQKALPLWGQRVFEAFEKRFLKT